MEISLPSQFKYSHRNTLIIQRGFKAEQVTTTSSTCTYWCLRDADSLPANIATIKEIKTIKIEFCPNFDYAAVIMMLGDLPNLEKLQLKSCEIINLPPEIGLLNLRELDLSNEGYGTNNEFTTLPPEIALLSNLKSLSLGHNNQFKRFPPEIAQLTNLTDLSLRGLNSLPENVELIPNLRNVNISHGHIIPQQILPLINRPNGLKSIKVSEGYYNIFQAATAEYPDFTVVSEQTSMRGNY